LSSHLKIYAEGILFTCVLSELLFQVLSVSSELPGLSELPGPVVESSQDIRRGNFIHLRIIRIAVSSAVSIKYSGLSELPGVSELYCQESFKFI
jgi:hypothetical protein